MNQPTSQPTSRSYDPWTHASYDKDGKIIGMYGMSAQFPPTNTVEDNKATWSGTASIVGTASQIQADRERQERIQRSLSIAMNQPDAPKKTTEVSEFESLFKVKEWGKTEDENKAVKQLSPMDRIKPIQPKQTDIGISERNTEDHNIVDAMNRVAIGISERNAAMLKNYHK